MCSVDFSDADLVYAPLAEVVGRTGVVPVSLGVTHVFLLLVLLYSASESIVPRRPRASLVIGMLMAHCWRSF